MYERTRLARVYYIPSIYIYLLRVYIIVFFIFIKRRNFCTFVFLGLNVLIYK